LILTGEQLGLDDSPNALGVSQRATVQVDVANCSNRDFLIYHCWVLIHSPDRIRGQVMGVFHMLLGLLTRPEILVTGLAIPTSLMRSYHTICTIIFSHFYLFGFDGSGILSLNALTGID
jgi:hypothetical protein